MNRPREEFFVLLERLSAKTAIRISSPRIMKRAYAIMQQVKNYSKVERVLENLYTEETVPKNKHPFLGDSMMKPLRVFGKHWLRAEKHMKTFC